jgi:hypothetical protein
MKTGLLAAAFLLALAAGPTRADMPIADYLAIGKGEGAVRPDFAVVYLAGTLDGLEAANAAARARGRPYYCPPGERAPTVLELKPALDDLLARAAAQQRDFERYARIVTVGTVSLTALARLFPCPEPAARGSGPASPGG